METRQPGLLYWGISSNLILPLNRFSRSFKGVFRASKSWGQALSDRRGMPSAVIYFLFWISKLIETVHDTYSISMLAWSSCQIWNVMRLSNQHFYLMSLYMSVCQKEPFLMYENGDSSFIHVPRAETDGSSGDVMSSVIKTLAPVITHFRDGKTGCHETLHVSPFSCV